MFISPTEDVCQAIFYCVVKQLFCYMHFNHIQLYYLLMAYYPTPMPRNYLLLYIFVISSQKSLKLFITISVSCTFFDTNTTIYRPHVLKFVCIWDNMQVSDFRQSGMFYIYEQGMVPNTDQNN